MYLEFGRQDHFLVDNWLCKAFCFLWRAEPWQQCTWNKRKKKSSKFPSEFWEVYVTTEKDQAKISNLTDQQIMGVDSGALSVHYYIGKRKLLQYVS